MTESISATRPRDYRHDTERTMRVECRTVLLDLPREERIRKYTERAEHGQPLFGGKDE